MKKRIASLLLALPLCLTLLPTTALAEDEAASDRTVIATVEDLQQFARAVDAGDYDGKTDAVVELAADLDLTGIEWTPIGSTVNADGEVEHCFSGKFYGNGHTVSNLDLSDVYGATVLCGFFGDIENAEISSLTVQGTINVNSEREYTYYGAIAGFAGGCTIFDCTADVSFTNNENLVYGMIGLCGQASDTVIDYCRNTGDLLLTGDAGSLYAGGIVGFADGDSEIRYCVNTGELSLAASHGGGIAGQLAGNAKVINCYATGKLTPYGKGTEDLGGIVGTAGGSAGSAAIQHCYFAGEMDMSQYTASAPYGRLGAIAGSAKETTAFENNYYAESNEVTACGKGVEAGKARTYEAMCSEDFYNELTAGGGQYQYNTPSTPVLPAPKYMVTFVVAPADMTNVVITVNGEPVEENAELEAGIYTVTVAADNCETVNKEITITADRATHTQQLELRYLDADYSKVEAAIAKAEALNKNEYKDFTKVEEAVNAVVRGKNITEQTEVEAMAKAIEDAIAALEYKDADYSKVDAAIAKAEALNKNGSDKNLTAEHPHALNAALDTLLARQSDPSAADTDRYHYKVDVASGSSTLQTETQVNYYVQLQNGSFEYPVVSDGNFASDRFCYPNDHQRAHFLQTRDAETTSSIYWYTTTECNRWGDGVKGKFIEIADATTTVYTDTVITGWDRKGNAIKETYTDPNDVTQAYAIGKAYDGGQFAELNCQAYGALYQDVLTVPGATLNWSLAHAGRDGTDTMALLIAPMDVAQDITDALKNKTTRAAIQEALNGSITVNGVNVPIRNYIVDGNISDGCTAWGVHNGTYTVPAGQYVSRFWDMNRRNPN